MLHTASYSVKVSVLMAAKGPLLASGAKFHPAPEDYLPSFLEASGRGEELDLGSCSAFLNLFLRPASRLFR
jgi:hypothetical protein